MNDARRAYQEAAVRGATPVRLTVLLYEQIIQDLNRAMDAITQHQPETCARELNHATAVLGYLQATLNPNVGATVAGNLTRFYNMLREQMMEAQVRSSRQILQELREHMLDIREAWLKVEAETEAVT